jgi:FixJ family two-component response regulator
MGRNANLAKVPVISIVDDDPSIREATKGLVRSLGYGAAAFASAEDFLQSDHVNDTACLITDVQMPGLSGVELQNRLIVQGNCTPIIFITAFPEERIRARALEAGAVGFLSKPFDEDCLIEYIHAALNGGKAGTVQS